MEIKNCIFPVAGYGTRFLPATKAMPKEMLPIVNKPLIQYAVEEALNSGMNQIGFVTGRHKRAIEDHFDINPELENKIAGTDKENKLLEIRQIISKCTFSYTRQNQIKGLGDAILTSQSLLGQVPFGVILADDLCVNSQNPVMLQLLKAYEAHKKSIVALIEVDASETHKYGIVDGAYLSDGCIRIQHMVEKPDAGSSPSNLAIIGRYILTPDIFGILQNVKPGKGSEIQLTDALQIQASNSEIIGCKVKAKRFDCGSVNGFVAATNYFYTREYQGNESVV